MQILDNPAWAALTGPQAGFAERHGRSARYPTDVSPFAALADPADPAAWRDLAELSGPGAEPLLAAPGLTGQPGWTHAGGASGVQLVGTGVRGATDPEALVLTAADVPEILDLVARTRPGPFGKRTPELGAYLGIRRGGALVALAGERMRLDGYTEISAVCTDPAHRGAGLAARLIRAVVAVIRARGDVPFLHAADDNTGAIRLYEHLGFTIRTPIVFGAYRLETPS
ncbi:GNAT family N-acetyltransferase [Actinoplanes sp. ATCC 53533]|uniref:GNAT family N-acetyltransferase n=1 Tax=Actinoplanes sp. ATCC 53533 TaxID=1288362 RepID=UPI000F78E030|nr:GNAT family N-acetyltransferase [Actinoplanes sp. ATCC 53533]